MIKITANEAASIADQARNGKRVPRIERWLLDIRSSAALGKNKARFYVEGYSKRMTIDEKRTLVELGFHVDENAIYGIATVSW